MVFNYSGFRRGIPSSLADDTFLTRKISNLFLPRNKPGRFLINNSAACDSVPCVKHGSLTRTYAVDRL